MTEEDLADAIDEIAAKFNDPARVRLLIRQYFSLSDWQRELVWQILERRLH